MISTPQRIPSQLHDTATHQLCSLPDQRNQMYDMSAAPILTEYVVSGGLTSDTPHPVRITSVRLLSWRNLLPQRLSIFFYIARSGLRNRFFSTPGFTSLLPF